MSWLFPWLRAWPRAMSLGLVGVSLVVQISASDAAAPRVLSPPTLSVSVTAAAITVEVRSSNWTAVTVTNTQLEAPVLAHRPAQGGNFFALNVPLQAGENTLVVAAQTTQGALSTTSLTVHTLDPQPLVHVSATPPVSEMLPAAITLQVETALIGSPSELLVDANGDGTIESTHPFAPAVTVSYPTVGRFTPLVTLRTPDNLLFTNLPAVTKAVAILPPSVPDPAQAFLNAGTQISDLALHPPTRQLFVLDAGAGVVRVFAPTGTLAQTIPLPGVSAPQGLALGTEGNVYIADTGNHRVLKLLAAAYAPDPALGPEGAFGTYGQEEGQLDSPEDVGVRPVGTADAIFVADTGNHRLQRFSALGQFELAFNGDLTAAGPLIAPRGVMGYDMENTIGVIDGGQGQICFLAHDGTPAECFGTVGTAIGAFRNPTKMAPVPVGRVVVADTDNTRIQIVGLGGEVDRVVPLPVAPRAVVLDRAPLGERLLVAPVTGSTILAIPLTTDPPDATPVAVVQAFLAAMGDKDIEAARAYVIEGEDTLLNAIAQNPQLLDQVALASQHIHSLTLEGMQGGTRDGAIAGVKGILELQGHTEKVSYGLRRHPFTGR